MSYAVNRCHGTSLAIILGSLFPGPPEKSESFAAAGAEVGRCRALEIG